MIDCIHWQPYGTGGKCAAFGKVSIGVCARCPRVNKPLGEIPVPRSGGPGAVLRAIFRKLRIHACAGCQCAAHAREMNAKGVDWCEANVDVIVGWLREEAARCGRMFTEMGARLIVRRAIAISRDRTR